MRVATIFCTLWKARSTTSFNHVYLRDHSVIVYQTAHWLSYWSDLQRREGRRANFGGCGLLPCGQGMGGMMLYEILLIHCRCLYLDDYPLYG